MKQNIKMSFYLRGLLLIICFCTQEIWAVVYTKQQVTGWIGESVTLSCESSLAPYAVYWGRVDQSDPTGFKQIAQNFNGDLENHSDKYNMHMNNSVTIKKLMVSDEDTYVCEVVTEKGEDGRNTTVLRINAPASRPLIEQCDESPEEPSSPDQPTVCQTATSSKYQIFNLECKVTGFRPNISLHWYTNGRVIKPLGDPTQTKRNDDTYDCVVTISVQAKPDAAQNFTCTASGEAVISKTSSAIVTVLVLPDDASPTAAASSGGLSAGGKFGIALFSIIVILAVIFAVLVLVGVFLRRHNKLPPKGEWALNKIPFLQKEAPPDPEEVRLEKLENQRTELRERIATYEIGDAAGITIHCNAERANINLFGQMSAGKSAFMNSLNFAFTGVWSEVSQEGEFESGGGMTIKRIHHPLTESINLIDNRGMSSFDTNYLDEIKETVRGERGIDPTQEVERDENSEIHCAVFVYHGSDFGRDEALQFMSEFNKELSRHYGRQPLFVLSHRNDPGIDLQELKQQLNTYGVSKNNIHAFENYTKNSHTEDLETDIEFLEFLLTALETCDRNIINLEKEKKEKPKPKKVPEKEKERTILFPKKKKKIKGVPFEVVQAPSVDNYEKLSAPDQERDKRCALM